MSGPPNPVGAAGLGFVVIGRNEGDRLSRCLASLESTGAPIAYADSASTDDSVNVARQAGAVTVELDRDQPMNAARGRNAGLSALRKAHPEVEFVQFIDGDCELQVGWVDTALDFLRGHARAAVACGLRFEAHPRASAYNRLCDEEWNTPIGLAPSCGGDAMMRVASLDEAGFFDPTLMAGEEPELCSRLRLDSWEIWRLDAPMTRHDAAMTRFTQWWRRAFRSGYGYAQAWSRTRGHTEPLYASHLRSAVFWAAVIPFIVLLVALLLRKPSIILAVPAIHALQIARTAARRGIFSAWSWHYASLMLVAKFAELLGALDYIFKRGRSAPIDIKEASKS